MSLGHGIHLGRPGAGPRKNKAPHHHAVATIKAGGGTDGYPALKEAYAVLFDRPALLKHVIFLSDGQMTRGGFRRPSAPHVQGQDHRLHRGHRQGRRRTADGRHRQVGTWALLLHRGFADHPADLHPGDAAGLQGLPRGAALQAHRDGPQPRGHAGHRLEGRAPVGRIRGHLGEGHRGTGDDEPPGRSGAGHLALWTGPVRCVHLGREGQVGPPVAALARLQQVLGRSSPAGPCAAGPAATPWPPWTAGTESAR